MDTDFRVGRLVFQGFGSKPVHADFEGGTIGRMRVRY